MKFLKKDKDGGPESTVYAYWLLEWKKYFSIALLKFDGLSRECYHTHAFNSTSWVLKGMLHEEFFVDFQKPFKLQQTSKIHTPSLRPVRTLKTDFHKVSSPAGVTWVLTFRGPWDPTWKESTKKEGIYTLTTGRKRLNENQSR